MPGSGPPRHDVLPLLLAAVSAALLVALIALRRRRTALKLADLYEAYLGYYLSEYAELRPEIRALLDEVSSGAQDVIRRLEMKGLLERSPGRILLQTGWLAGRVLRSHQPNRRLLAAGGGDPQALWRQIEQADRFFEKLRSFLRTLEAAADRCGAGGPSAAPPVPPAQPLSEDDRNNADPGLREALADLESAAERVRPVTTEFSLISAHDGAKEAFEKMGLKCLQCAAVGKETVETASRYHPFDKARLLELITAGPSPRRSAK